MAHSESARKRIRQNNKTNLRNRVVKSDLRTAIKNLRVALSAAGAAASAEASKLLATVESKLDKASKRNIIPRGRANRLKGRLKKTARKSAKPAA